MNAEIEKLGARLVAVSPQLPEHSRRMEKRLQLHFPILFDENNEAAAEWGLTFDLSPGLQEIYSSFGIDVPAHNGTATWTLPMPARFVVAAGGLIHQSAVHPDYTIRPEPQTTLETLRAL